MNQDEVYFATASKAFMNEYCDNGSDKDDGQFIFCQQIAADIALICLFSFCFLFLLFFKGRQAVQVL